MRTRDGALLAFFGVGLLLVTGGFAYLWLFSYDAPVEPPGIRRGSIQVDGRERTYLYYVPERRAVQPPLVLAFHGSKGTGQRLREWTGYGLERLADENGFVVVYPDGFENHWNDCRARGPYSANTLDIDDPGFVRALVERFRRELGAGTHHVFAIGFSNGAHMAFRLALESPREVTAIAAIGANLPGPGELDCTPAERPVAALIMNGTTDPINPYHGGVVTLFGFGNRGEVLSTGETAAYFARLAGHASEPSSERLEDRDGDPETWVERSSWTAPSRPEVVLYTIAAGGHAIPQAGVRFPRILGHTSREIDGPAEVWAFFERQMDGNAAFVRAGAGVAVQPSTGPGRFPAPRPPRAGSGQSTAGPSRGS